MYCYFRSVSPPCLPAVNKLDVNRKGAAAMRPLASGTAATCGKKISNEWTRYIACE